MRLLRKLAMTVAFDYATASSLRACGSWSGLGYCFFRAFGAFAVVWIEEEFAQADGFWRDFEQFVVLDVGEGFFEGHADRGREAHGFVLAGGADVGELFALEQVHFEIVVARVFADDHALIDFPARLDHHRAAIFQIPHGIGDSFADIVRDQHAIAAAGNVTLPRCIGMEDPVHDRGAARVGEELGAIPEEATRGDLVHQAHEPLPRVLHLDHARLAGAELLDDGPHELLGDVDRELLVRLQPLAVEPDVAVTAPPDVTRKGAEAAVALPAQSL